MKVYLNKITGIDDALVSLLMSKRTWTREKELEIRKMVRSALTEEGFLKENEKDFLLQMDKLIKYGVGYGHTTLLRFIDLSFTVEGLHRGGQDDFDSHAKRLDSRIVRSSTRLATFEQGEFSDYYKGKVLTPEDICGHLGIELPKEIDIDGTTYVKGAFGYIKKGLEDNKDVKRGLYPLGIPSNFIFKVQYPEFGHIYQHRCYGSTANPEVQQMVEMAREDLNEKMEPLGRNLEKIKMQKG